MSEKWNTPKVLQSLNFKLDESQDIGVLLDAAMPGNKYQFLSVLGMTISMSNSDAVRFFSKQHPNVSSQCFDDFFIDNIPTQLVVVGPFGVGKSSAVDVCQWQLCGSKESAKIDPG